MATNATTFLISTQDPDGGWGYATGQASSVEASAAAVLALHIDREAAVAAQRGLVWLAGAQHDNGGWGIASDDPQSGWQTAWAVLTLSLSGGDKAIIARGAQWLLDVETPEPTEDAMQRVQPLLDIDLTLRGWPWQPGQATWIEPTALAMLALAAAGYPDTSRIVNAVRYLTDRRCEGGGWNVGNPVMFSQPLPARAHPTAWVLLALARLAPDVILPEDVVSLRSAMTEDGGAPALAWGLLALHTLGLDVAAASARLVALQREDGSWNANPYHTAVAVLASRGGTLW